jgi:hypothetical protein
VKRSKVDCRRDKRRTDGEKPVSFVAADMGGGGDVRWATRITVLGTIPGDGFRLTVRSRLIPRIEDGLMG